MGLDQLTSILTEYGQLVLSYFSRPTILFQLAIIGVLFVPALFLSWRVESKLEARARAIKGMPGLLRLVVVFLRRLDELRHLEDGRFFHTNPSASLGFDCKPIRPRCGDRGVTIFRLVPGQNRKPHRV